jgi:hypothetical protein
MGFKMKGHTLPGINQKVKMAPTRPSGSGLVVEKKNSTSLSDGRAKSSAFQKNTDPKKDSKGNISFTDKTNIMDQALIKKAADKTKTGGRGATDEDKKATIKAKRRQETRDSYKKPKSELSKEVGGSKIKNFFTSKKKLRSKANAKRLNEMKTTEGQVMKTKTKDALGGDKYTGVS